MVLKIATNNGFTYTEAVRVSLHFAVHPTPATFGTRGWSATHIPTGMAGSRCLSIVAAVEAALAFEACGEDWDFDDPNDARNRDKALKIAQAFAGLA